MFSRKKKKIPKHNLHKPQGNIGTDIFLHLRKFPYMKHAQVWCLQLAVRQRQSRNSTNGREHLWKDVPEHMSERRERQGQGARRTHGQRCGSAGVQPPGGPGPVSCWAGLGWTVLVLCWCCSGAVVGLCWAGALAPLPAPTLPGGSGAGEGAAAQEHPTTCQTPRCHSGAGMNIYVSAHS